MQKWTRSRHRWEREAGKRKVSPQERQAYNNTNEKSTEDTGTKVQLKSGLTLKLQAICSTEFLKLKPNIALLTLVNVYIIPQFARLWISACEGSWVYMLCVTYVVDAWVMFPYFTHILLPILNHMRIVHSKKKKSYKFEKETMMGVNFSFWDAAYFWISRAHLGLIRWLMFLKQHLQRSKIQ